MHGPTKQFHVSYGAIKNNPSEGKLLHWGGVGGMGSVLSGLVQLQCMQCLKVKAFPFHLIVLQNIPGNVMQGFLGKNMGSPPVTQVLDKNSKRKFLSPPLGQYRLLFNLGNICNLDTSSNPYIKIT